MTDHSPTPWRCRPYLNNGGSSLTVEDANGDAVGTVRGWCGDPDPSPANASLIAAAPDLLEAAKDALTFLAIVNDDGEMDWAREKIRAAIDKAERRTP